MGPGDWGVVDFLVDDLGELMDGLSIDLAFQIFKFTELVPEWLWADVLVV